MTAELRAINCTSCGAGLDVLGGGRVQTYVCPYCGSALDAQENFKVLQQFDQVDRPATHLALGDKGQIAGVEFVVIGVIGWEEQYGRRIWQWTDHQVYSPTHGYGWITHEDDGSYTFTRKVRKLPSSWLTLQTVELSEYRPTVWLDGKRYRYYDSGVAQITFLEGAFNWQPQMGHFAATVRLIGEGEMLNLSGRDTEREVEMTRAMTGEETASFGLPKPRFNPFAPLDVGPRWAHYGFAMVTLIMAAVLALGLLGAVSNAGFDTLAVSRSVGAQALPIELSVDVPDDANLLKVEFRSDVVNGWMYFDASLETDTGEGAQEGGAELSFYRGRDADGPWTEGRQSASVTFSVTHAGAHILSIDRPETGLEGVVTDRFDVIVKSRSVSTRPLLAALGLFCALAILLLASEEIRRRRQLLGSDWTYD